MVSPQLTRARTALFTIPLGGILGLAGILLRGAHGLPVPDATSWAQASVSDNFAIARFALIAGYVLPFPGFWAMYAVLGEHVERSAFWGFMLSVWGTALALPALGIAAFAGPPAASLTLQNNPFAADLITEALTGSGLVVGIAAAVCYTIGPVLLGIATWWSGALPKASGVLFALHGLCLSFGFGFYPVLVLGWVLLIASGAWQFAYARQASAA